MIAMHIFRELTTTDKRLKRPSLKKETTSPSLRALMAAYPSDAHEIVRVHTTLVS